MKIVPYAFIVGSLMYPMMCTRSDIAHAVGVVSRSLTLYRFTVDKYKQVERSITETFYEDDCGRRIDVC